MSKIIVVERCGDCPYMKWTGETTACPKTGMDIDPLSPDFDKYEAGAGMSDWCPLSPLPEKRNTTSLIETKHEAEENHVTPQHQAGFNLGWNACLDAITGEEKE